MADKEAGDKPPGEGGPDDKNKEDPNNPDGTKKEQPKKSFSERVMDCCKVILNFEMSGLYTTIVSWKHHNVHHKCHRCVPCVYLVPY